MRHAPLIFLMKLQTEIFSVEVSDFLKQIVILKSEVMCLKYIDVTSRELRPKVEKEETSQSSLSKIPTKCLQCKQLLDDPDLRMFPGPPEDAVSYFHLLIQYFSHSLNQPVL